MNQICPLCALANRNETHGMGKRAFHGPVAHQLFEDSRAHIIASKQSLTDWEQSIPKERET